MNEFGVDFGADAPAAAPAAPVTAQQAVDKIDAKATADKVVNTDPNAVHHVKILGLNAKTGSSAATGAAIGLVAGGPPGALIGAAAGFAVERYQVLGGPIGKLVDKAKALIGKK